MSSQEVAAAIRAKGGNISHTTIWKLRTGLETNPRVDTLGLLAEHFGVSAKYFFDEEYADTVSRQLRLLGAVRDGKLLGVAARLGELSQAGQKAIADVIERVLDDEQEGKAPDAGTRGAGNQEAAQGAARAQQGDAAHAGSGAPALGGRDSRRTGPRER
ncbi:XRE family transcriptional regulator [Streptomyces sp. NPDC102467]|uniref:XRE family transcriptional regulator n=1 Tax=Streptomyces sp. NPDC102467 TaxID=3366179 RepID=UPI00382EC83F